MKRLQIGEVTAKKKKSFPPAKKKLEKRIMAKYKKDYNLYEEENI